MTAIWMLAHALLAQGNIEGPSLGVIWDAKAAAVRRVAGVPGSAVITATIASPVALRSAAVAADRAAAVGADGRVYRLDSQWAPVSLPEGALRTILSADGQVVAALYPDRQARIAACGTAPWLVSLEDEPAALAVNNDGSLLLSANASRVTVITAGGNRWHHDLGAPVHAVVFTGRGSDALAAASNGLWLIRDAAAVGDRRLLWEGDAWFTATARGGRVALAAAAGSLSISVVDLESLAVFTVETPAPVAALARLGSGDSFRFTSDDAATAWMLDLSQPQARVLFLPAIGTEE